MAITAALVKELRERTSAGMMECKKALVETDGDIDAAVDYMRKAGLAKADKKAGRIAAEGLIGVALSEDGKTAAMVEINSETDFVSKGDQFIGFVKEVADLALANNTHDIDSLLAVKMADGNTIVDAAKALVVSIGEKVSVRRVAVLKTTGVIGAYSHGSRIVVLVDMQGGDQTLAKDIAMHVAASSPICVSADDVAPELIEKEKEIFSAQALESGKPEDIVEKMVTGRINKYLKEVTLLGQPFVKDPDVTVEKLLAGASASVSSFHRFEVGEGIDKKEENFADEVMAQVKDSK